MLKLYAETLAARVMAPFRQQPPFYKDDEEEDDDADDEVDGDEDDVLAPSAGPGNAVQRPAITNTAGLAAALDDIAWPSTVTWVDTLVVRVRLQNVRLHGRAARMETLRCGFAGSHTRS